LGAARFEEISRIQHDCATGAIVVSSASGGGSQRTTFPGAMPARLLAFAHERMSATRVVATRIEVDSRQLPVEGRRQPGTDRVHWLVRLDDDLDFRDVALRARIEGAVSELRAVIGV
jgi:hypothetical protein